MDMKHGASPRIENRIIPGKRKSANGECSKMDKGKPPINFPDGEMINMEPPPKALKPRNNNIAIRIFLAIVVFIISYLKF